MAGIVGRERYQFDIWGDTVNVASRLTSAASPQSVALTEAQAKLDGLSVSPRTKDERSKANSTNVQQVLNSNY